MCEHVPIHNWKSSVSDVMKARSELHFQFAASKRVVLTKTKNSTVVIKGEVNYRVDIGTFKPFVKKGKRVTSISPEQLPPQVPVKAVQIEDVKKLLHIHFGEGWDQREDMDYYRQVLFSECDVDDIDEAKIPLRPEYEDEFRI
ncbi:hypothetical protein PR048_016114 [Dryococelus australis]|uniref:Uncharacterized protein n=1 Tax=Dryococelus australis TaxID=614101 RepID=A0ABQ9HJ39_9NEOP|nr:hypothetical protein PR048_016114 [Dryococelus australis]